MENDSMIEEEEMFHLKSVMCHSGRSINSGHYWTAVKENGKTVTYDDALTSVKRPDFMYSHIVESSCYLLVYEARSKRKEESTEHSQNPDIPYTLNLNSMKSEHSQIEDDKTPLNLNNMKIAQLRAELKKRNVKTTGLKADLVARLKEILGDQDDGNTDKRINFSKIKEDIEKMSDCKILYTIGKYTLRKNDVLSIVGRNWLTDQVVNAMFLKMCNQNRRMFFKDTFFLLEVDKRGLQLMRRIPDVREKYLVFFPIHTLNHWSLIVVNVRQKTISYLDSMENFEPRPLKVISDFMEQNGISVSRDKELETNIPRQQNAGDCGVFVIRYAKCLIEAGDIKRLKVNGDMARKEIVCSLGMMNK
ncbi:sentrin-specific protease 1-like [Mytilus edulis]|uniref:sentrin-specific protease 1-like n=1 Tax=Mytilus edulis TaxID=6550 RepID=UPI0039EEE053